MASVEDSILHSIRKNGYPGKKVSLPFQAVFQSCKSKGIPLATVLKNLEKHEIQNEIVGDRILFHSKDCSKAEAKKSNPFDIPDGLFSEAMKKIDGMDPAEVEQIKKQVMEMSPEDRNDLLNKAQELFNTRNK